jgi:hypothetical protein
MRKLIKIILPKVEVKNLKIRPRGDNRSKSAKSKVEFRNPHLLTSSPLKLARIAP